MKNTNEKQNLLCKKAVYFNYRVSLFKDGCYLKKNVMLLDDLSVTPSLPTKRSAATFLSQSLQLINICNTLYSNQKHHYI